MCILVADDDPVVRDVVRRYLERDGRTVLETGDGRTARAAPARIGAPAPAADLAPPRDGAVTVHIERLRAELGSRHRIETVWGRGYAWGRSDIDAERADAR